MSICSLVARNVPHQYMMSSRIVVSKRMQARRTLWKHSRFLITESYSYNKGFFKLKKKWHTMAYVNEYKMYARTNTPQSLCWQYYFFCSFACQQSTVPMLKPEKKSHKYTYKNKIENVMIFHTYVSGIYSEWQCQFWNNCKERFQCLPVNQYQKLGFS